MFLNSTKLVLFGMLLLMMLTMGLLSTASADFECGGEAELVQEAIDTVFAVALYACTDTSIVQTLPTWYADVWDSTRNLSVPRYYAENSNYKHVVFADPFGRTDDSCFLGPAQYTPNPPWGNANFNLAIVSAADELIDFGNYDEDGDNYVDYIFMMYVNFGVSGGYNGFPLPGIYYTNDTSEDGDTIKITSSGCTVYANREVAGVFVTAHEYGHDLGFSDIYSYNHMGYGGVGGFSIMARGVLEVNGVEIPVPIDPFHKAQIGWVSPIVVVSPLFQEEVDFFNYSDDTYRIERNSNESFYTSNHRTGESAPYWEQNYPNYGLLIWHIDKNRLNG